MPKRGRGISSRANLTITLEPVPKKRVMRMAYTPNLNLSSADKAAMRRCLERYGRSVTQAGRRAGRVFERAGVLYIKPDPLLDEFEPQLSLWGTFGKAVRVSVPEMYT